MDRTALGRAAARGDTAAECMNQNPYTVRVGGMRSLEDALREMPPELHIKILPAGRALALNRTSKTTRMAVQKARVHAKIWTRSVFPEGLGLLENLNRLMACCNVTVLGLSICQLGEGGARVMLEFLRLNTTLEKLFLASNNLGCDGARALAEALCVNTTLRELQLSNNHMRDDGARALAEALRSNTTLTSLCLGENELGEDGARALAGALCVNTTLHKLDFSYNEIGEGGVQALTAAMIRNTTLMWLYFDED